MFLILYIFINLKLNVTEAINTQQFPREATILHCEVVKLNVDEV